MDFRKKLKVEPGSKVRLRDIDPGWHSDYESGEDAARDLDAYRERITEQQRIFYADRSRSLLIVLQGIDAAGKDGTTWNVIGAMDPQGVRVTSFKQPTPEELSHDFLWRIHKHTPARGQVAVFNRSHYEDVLIVRVHELVQKTVWQGRYDTINAFERMLHDENRTTILKFFLYISREEQLERFKDRLDDPTRQWKIAEFDYSERDRWDEYMAAFEDALTRCSTEAAPWYVIPSNRKWFRNLAVSQIIADTMEDMGLKCPAPSVNIDRIRKLYHAEKREERAENGKKKKGG